MLQPHRHGGGDRRHLQGGNVHIGHFQVCRGRYDLAVSGGARRRDGHGAGLDALGQALAVSIVDGGNGIVTAAPAQASICRHILHGAIAHSGLGRVLQLKSDRELLLRRGHLQGNDGRGARTAALVRLGGRTTVFAPTGHHEQCHQRRAAPGE
ncbi:hypothetical protein D3C84_792760 [compost metagenome]